MAGIRSLRRLPSLKSLVARKRKRVRYTEYLVSRPVKSPAVLTGEKLSDG